MVLHIVYSVAPQRRTACFAGKLLLCGWGCQSDGKKSCFGQSTPSSIQLSHEGKYIVNIDKSIKIADVKPNIRVAVRSDNYILHKILPTKVDPLVSLMKVEKVPDSTYDMIGGLDQQVK